MRAGAESVDVTGLKTAVHIAAGEVTFDTVRVNALGGNDKVDVAPDLGISSNVDLGTGQK